MAVVTEQRKPISSREAMTVTRVTSPYYRSWIRSSPKLIPQAVSALKARDIEALGAAVRLSYSRMHAVLLASDPPLTYWTARTLTVLNSCARLRREGIGVWETMDAGPQVKMLCLSSDVARIKQALSEQDERIRFIEAYPGLAPRFVDRAQREVRYA